MRTVPIENPSLTQQEPPVLAQGNEAKLLRLPHYRWWIGAIAILLVALSSPNRVVHWFPGALVGLAPLFYWGWNASWGQKIRISAAIWFGICVLVFVPDVFSVKSLSWAEIVGGIVVSPIVPLFYVLVTATSLHLTRRCPLWLRPLAIAAVWTSFDSFMALVRFPLPLHYGACIFDFTLAIQIADMTGVWGVTFLAILSNATLAAVARAVPRHRWRVAGVGVGLWGVTLLYGSWRLPAFAAFDVASDPRFTIGTVQQMAWLENDRTWPYRAQRYAEIQDLTKQMLAQGVDLVVWPEGALRAQVAGTDLERFVFEPILPLPRGTKLITGSSEPDPRTANLSWEQQQFINTALLYDASGEIRDRYGKQWLFQYFETKRFVPSPDGYRPLRGGERLGQLGVMVCLESVMPEPSRELVRAGAQTLIAISDDSWFGNSNWPILHASLSVFRAVELRRSFTFVNNTGGNLVIDPSGKIQQRGPFWQSGTVVGDVWLRDDVTVAARWGDWFAVVTVISALGLGLWEWRDRRTSKPRV
ncbi:MAG: nitrilase-related carbon-nitrogen hydrolase [Cyanobacteria bacterium P01_F01_bin.33]